MLDLHSATFNFIPIFTSYIYLITPGVAHAPFSHKHFAQLSRKSK